MSCPCGLPNDFESCCGPIISHVNPAPTAEKLMRARYTAYTKGKIDFIQQTLAPEKRSGFRLSENEKWAKESTWLGLEIIKTILGGPTDRKGTVEFVAKYKDKNGEEIEHHEVATFRKNENGEWLFVDGDHHVHRGGHGHHHHHHHHVQQTVIRDQPKIGRNEPCPCGSGKKFKKCCG